MGNNDIHTLSPSAKVTWRQGAVMCGAVAMWLAITASCLTLRPEHLVLAAVLIGLFFACGPTRRLVVALIPFALFGISYDWMNLWHNYEVNPNVDIQGLYQTEKSLFGITMAEANRLTPNEFFAVHHSAMMDFLAGFFYLCWVPVPILFGLWLYARGQRKTYLHFALVFLLVNWIGFVFYYVHPAAPPWYVAKYGFDFIQGTPGDVAGLGRFDALTGLNIFEGLYGRNSNVFAALPSLHSAYMPIALFYSLRARCSWWLRGVLIALTVGIWFTAVYSSHHYIIDVMAGVACTIVGIAIFEGVLMRWGAFSRFIDRYVRYIS